MRLGLKDESILPQAYELRHRAGFADVIASSGRLPPFKSHEKLEYRERKKLQRYSQKILTQT